MNPIQLELTTDMFDAFGSLCPGTRSALSPLQPFGASSTTTDQKFIQAGILDPQNQVKEPFISLLSNLARTDVHLELSWDNSGEQESLSIYSLRRMVSSNLYAPTFVGSRQTGRLTLHSPFTRSDLDAELRPLLEMEAEPVPQLGVGLTAEQAVVLSTLMDLQRQLNAVQEKIKPSNRQTPAQIGWNSSKVLGALHRLDDADKSFWVFSFPVMTLIPIQDWNLENLQYVISSLAKLGLFTQTKDTDYSFSEPMMKIIEHFTVFGKLLWLSVRREADESEDLPAAEEEHFGFCAHGLNLVFSFVDNVNFILRTLSNKSFTDMIAKDAFPQILPEMQNQSVPIIPKATIPVKKKNILQGINVGLVVLVALACVLMLFGAVILLLYYK